MNKFTISIDIITPVERVWEIMFDITRWHEWTQSIKSIKQLDEGPFQIGSRVLIKQPKFPPAIWKVTEMKPGVSFTWISVAPGLQVKGIHNVDPTTQGSRATLSVEIKGLFGALWAMITKNITEKYLGHEAKGLKARSENPLYKIVNSTPK